jgi:2-polyprenyl-3-methyl-5-hydroxy-6-metoxy-1,4-benzoquinol methylase
MKKRGYDLYVCDFCGHIMVHPLPPKKDLEIMYSFGKGYQLQKDFRFEGGYKFSKPFIDAIKKFGKPSSGGTLLDVGCSNGEFSVLAMREGYDVKAVEINKDTALIARKNGVDVRVCTLEDSEFKSAYFDAAHLGDVIEHVRDLGSFMKELARVMKPGAVILVKTPNHDAFFPKSTLWLYKNLMIPWSHPTPPHHLNQFTPESIKLLLGRYGFSVKEYYYAKCSLRYELGATYVFSDFKQSLKNKDIFCAIKYGLVGSLVLATYGPIWLMDRFITGKPDFNMNVLAVRDYEQCVSYE